jgi:hypothetical protein
MSKKHAAGVPPQGTLVLLLPGIPRQAALKKLDGRWTKAAEQAAKRMARTPERVKIPAPVMQKLWQLTGGWSTPWVAHPTGPWAHLEITELKVTTELSVMLNRDGAFMRWRGRFVAVNWKPHWSRWRNVMKQSGTAYEDTSDLQSLGLVDAEPLPKAEEKTTIVVTDGKPRSFKPFLDAWQRHARATAGKGIGQLILNAPPGSGKSSFVSLLSQGGMGGASGMEFTNAFFDQSGSMGFGDHHAQNIVAHETSHGGAINESFSDIFASDFNFLTDEINPAEPRRREVLAPEQQKAVDSLLATIRDRKPFKQ